MSKRKREDEDPMPRHMAVRGHGKYSVPKLFDATNELETSTMSLSELEAALDVKMWANDEGNLEFSPRHLLDRVVDDRGHWKRVQDADLSFPILLFDIKANWNIMRKYQSRLDSDSMLMYGQYDVLDGNHRLAKTKLLKLDTILVKIVPWEVLRSTLWPTPKKPKNDIK